jgi:RNA polymerase sigma-70 factor (ECF subfamily)
MVDDALQDVFLTVHRRLPDFEGRSSVKTWIYSITHHTARNYRRRAQRDSGEVLSPELPVDGPTPRQHAEGAQASEFVMEFLDSVSSDKRDVFVLCVLEELTAPDAAQVLDVKLNTVYSRLRLVRAEFRVALLRFSARPKVKP